MGDILIIGHANHGKDTLAEIIRDEYGLGFESSSMAAARIFLYEALRRKYGYRSFQECYSDRVNHRDEWHDLISEYNREDPARLAKLILSTSQMYVGMRSDIELASCVEQGLFDLIVGVFDPGKPLEPESSFKIDMFKWADIIFPTAGTPDDLRRRVKKVTIFNAWKKEKNKVFA